MTIKTVKLDVRHDGIQANANVLVDVGEPLLRRCSLDDVIEAAAQDDAILAADYAAILSQVASELCLVVRKEIDGSSDNGCCWYSIDLRHGINGDVLTTRSHKITRGEIRGWHPTPEQTKAATQAILRRACSLGLRQAQYWVGTCRTVAEAAK